MNCDADNYLCNIFPNCDQSLITLFSDEYLLLESDVCLRLYQLIPFTQPRLDYYTIIHTLRIRHLFLTHGHLLRGETFHRCLAYQDELAV